MHFLPYMSVKETNSCIKRKRIRVCLSKISTLEPLKKFFLPNFIGFNFPGGYALNPFLTSLMKI